MAVAMDDTRNKAEEHGGCKLCRWTRPIEIMVVSGRTQRVVDGHEELASGPVGRLCASHARDGMLVGLAGGVCAHDLVCPR